MMVREAFGGMAPALLEKNLEVVAESRHFADHREYAGGDMHFALWLVLVDRKVQGVCGLGIFDLADVPYGEYYVDGITPTEAAGLALAGDDTASMFGFGLR